MNAHIRTHAEIDESQKWDFWQFATDYGMQYYTAGRFAVFAGHIPTAGNQLHHALEFLLKACLAYKDSWDQIKDYGTWASYRHDVEKLWAEFKNRNADPALAAHDDLIAQLQKFENIRYPEKMRELNRMFTFSVIEIAPGQETRSADGRRYETYDIQLPKVDRLVQRVYQATHCPVSLQQYHGHPDAKAFLWRDNATPPFPRPDWIP
jgi:hypothetical protein